MLYIFAFNNAGANGGDCFQSNAKGKRREQRCDVRRKSWLRWRNKRKAQVNEEDHESGQGRVKESLPRQ
jgi:hypothetical protein